MNKPHLDNDELEMALDGFLPDDRGSHLNECSDCQSRLEQAKNAIQRIKGTLYRQTCPSSDTLIDFDRHALDSREHQNVQQHIHSCPRCQEELMVMRSFLESLDIAPPPPVNKQRHVPLFSRKLSQYSAAAAAVRGQVQKKSFQFNAKGVHVFLQYTVEASGFAFKGQFVTDEIWNGTTIAVHHQGIKTHVFANDIGEFEFVIPETNSISIYMTNEKGQTIIIEDIKFNDD